MAELTVGEIIYQIMQLIMKAKLRSEMTPSEWLAALLFLHKRGWLYVKVEDNEVHTAVGAFRIKEFIDEKKDEWPEKEDGTILYVPFALSLTEDRFIFKKMAEEYIRANPDLTEIIFEDNNNRIRRYKMGEKEAKENGKGESKLTEHADMG